ncbi:MAG: hypothetical protein OXD30_09890 [Bryobacterales bacterium]|nr:hypothetical protein [Bryobacterales bacterium]
MIGANSGAICQMGVSVFGDAIPPGKGRAVEHTCTPTEYTKFAGPVLMLGRTTFEIRRDHDAF